MSLRRRTWEPESDQARLGLAVGVLALLMDLHEVRVGGVHLGPEIVAHQQRHGQGVTPSVVGRIPHGTQA
jgi:hypothetical protein